MNRLAIFVEGQTEQEFVMKLVSEIAGELSLQVETHKASGRRGKRRFIRQFIQSDAPGLRYYVLIVDSAGDETVLSDIFEQYKKLVAEGYDRVIGIRDVWPKRRRADINRVESAMRKAIDKILPSRAVPVDLVLAVMEMEAWFIAEHTHFKKIDQSITCDKIHEQLGFDPSEDDVEKIDHPSRRLDQIYSLAGRRYRKQKGVVQRTVHSLDYEKLYLDVRHRVPRLGALIDQIDAFISQR